MRLFPTIGSLDTPSGRSALLATPFSGVWGLETGPSIRRAVVHAIQRDASLAALVGGRIFDRYIPEDVPDRPALILTLVSIVDDESIEGAFGQSVARFQIQTNTPVDAAAEAGECGERAARALRLLFHRRTNVTWEVPDNEPVEILWARRDGVADLVVDTKTGGEPVVITRSDFLFCYLDTDTPPR